MKRSHLVLLVISLAVVPVGFLVILLFAGNDILGFIASIDRDGDSPVPPGTEVVMLPLSRIAATTPKGTIVITAGKGLKRSYTWEGATRYVQMRPRTTRWYGSLGIYWPGPGNHWKKHNGVTRGVLEEGQLHFKTLEEVQEWLAKQKAITFADGRPYMPYVYRNDGLVVGWDMVLERSQLDVNVWQLYINGKKPESLPGSEDDKIVVEQASEPPT